MEGWGMTETTAGFADRRHASQHFKFGTVRGGRLCRGLKLADRRV